MDLQDYVNHFDSMTTRGTHTSTTPLSMVFLTKCADCGAQIRVTSVAETRLRMLCNQCAAKAFPETYYTKSAQM